MRRDTVQSSGEFWDNVFSRGQADDYSRVELPDMNDPTLRKALAHFGDIKGRTIIDLGCGRGSASLFFARCGAQVISLDASEVAIANLSRYCEENDITGIRALRLPAQDIASLEKADFVYGSMILHHVEPFAVFAADLKMALKPGGRGFFWENNGQSGLMLWFRKNVVGRAWVPKYGDPEEFPLTPGEIDALRKHFNVKVEFPELLYFRMISYYLFRGHLERPFRFLDEYFYRFPALRKYSYQQHLYLS